MSYVYFWEYEVDPTHAAEFEALYGPSGEWVELFRSSPGYLRTELHRDRDHPHRFVTIDYWESAQAWQEWRAKVEVEYEELDRRAARLTVTEREIGRFDLTGNGRG